MKKFKGLPLCPVCNSMMEVKALECPSCEVKLEGTFTPSSLKYLGEKEEEFVMLFLQARGNIKEMERLLGISYPTVRSKLEAIIEKLGLTPIEVEEEEKFSRMEILRKLEKGELSSREAAELIKKERR